MSYLVTVPDALVAAARDLASIGSAVSAANSAATPMSQLAAAARDEVSSAVATLFAEQGQAFQALTVQATTFHERFIQTMTSVADQYAGAESAGVSLLRTGQQNSVAMINSPAQTLGGTPVGGLGALLTGGPSINLGGLTTSLTGGLTDLNLGGLTSSLTGELTSLNVGGLSGLLTGELSNLNLGGLTSLLTGGLPGLNLGGLANVPYNLFADVVNMPYYESLALQEYAFALGPAGSVGGVPGWIPPGATIANGGVKVINGLQYYASGGTGSWYMESIGNTWGWDNGNWPQVDALLHFALPFPFTESLAEQVQTFAQAELIDGAVVNNEFQAGNPLAYLGGWLHGDTPIASLLAGTTFPNTITDSVGANSSTGIINVGPNGDGTLAIWAGQPAQLQPLAPLQAIAANLTASPAQNPIMFPDPISVFTNSIQLDIDLNTNFNPWATGSFLYWGAPTAYSIPNAIAGTLQDFTGIPSQFPLANHGAEPLWGYTAGPSSLLTGLPEGAQYLQHGLLGYLNPDIYAQALSRDIGLLTNPAELLHAAPLVGYLGLDGDTPIFDELLRTLGLPE